MMRGSDAGISGCGMVLGGRIKPKGYVGEGDAADGG